MEEQRHAARHEARQDEAQPQRELVGDEIRRRDTEAHAFPHEPDCLVGRDHERRDEKRDEHDRDPPSGHSLEQAADADHRHVSVPEVADLVQEHGLGRAAVASPQPDDAAEERECRSAIAGWVHKRPLVGAQEVDLHAEARREAADEGSDLVHCPDSRFGVSQAKPPLQRCRANPGNEDGQHAGGDGEDGHNLGDAREIQERCQARPTDVRWKRAVPEAGCRHSPAIRPQGWAG